MKKAQHDAPPPGLAQRDDVRLLANRCPFCRDDVSQDSELSVACQACLTRHHAPCWQEAGRCSSCGDERVLARLKTPRRGKAILGRLAYVSLGFMLAMGLIVGAVVYVAFQVYDGSQAGTVQASTDRARSVPDGAVVQVSDGSVYGAFRLYGQSTSPEQASYSFRWVDAQGKLHSGEGVARRSSGPGGGQHSPYVIFGPFSLEWSMSGAGSGWIYPGSTYVRVTPYLEFEAAKLYSLEPYTDGAGRELRPER
jgi:hypothetical protein